MGVGVGVGDRLVLVEVGVPTCDGGIMGVGVAGVVVTVAALMGQSLVRVAVSMSGTPHQQPPSLRGDYWVTRGDR